MGITFPVKVSNWPTQKIGVSTRKWQVQNFQGVVPIPLFEVPSGMVWSDLLIIVNWNTSAVAGSRQFLMSVESPNSSPPYAVWMETAFPIAVANALQQGCITTRYQGLSTIITTVAGVSDEFATLPDVPYLERWRFEAYLDGAVDANDFGQIIFYYTESNIS